MSVFDCKEVLHASATCGRLLFQTGLLASPLVNEQDDGINASHLALARPAGTQEGANVVNLIEGRWIDGHAATLGTRAAIIRAGKLAIGGAR